MGFGNTTDKIVRFPQRYVDGEAWEPWVDEHAIARHFSVSTRTVRRWRVAGMPSLLVGAQRRYRIAEAERWHREPPARARRLGLRHDVRQAQDAWRSTSLMISA